MVPKKARRETSIRSIGRCRVLLPLMKKTAPRSPPFGPCQNKQKDELKHGGITKKVWAELSFRRGCRVLFFKPGLNLVVGGNGGWREKGKKR